MALISCPDCNTEVSDKAPACPRCGNPIAAKSDVIAVGTPLTTIQETSKRLKAQQLGAIVMLIIGVVIFANREPGEPTILGSLMMFGGSIWYVVTRFRIWWNHK